MDGVFKKLVFVLSLLTALSCKKDEKTNLNNNKIITEARNLIRLNSNVLIDSVEQFDVPLPNGKHVMPQITIGLIDSIPKRDMKLRMGRSDGDTFAEMKLEKDDLVNFRSPYKLNLVKVKNDDTNILFVTFSELSIRGNHAFVVVKKVRGIGMVKNTYYFEKQNGRWVFIKKGFSKMG
ncbi:MAG: hypothetical protein ABI576_00460 [Flavobacterium sp.]